MMRLLALLVCFLVGAAANAAPQDTDAALKQADDIKTADHAQFEKIIQDLDRSGAALSPAQRLYLRYLQAWEVAYRGDYAAAIPSLNQIINETDDVTLRFRASVTVINVLAIAKRYEEAYAQLNLLQEMMPQVTDRGALEQGVAVAALVYNMAGQYDLGARFARRLGSGEFGSRSQCKSAQFLLESLYRSEKLTDPDDAQFRNGIAACTAMGEILRANLIRTYVVSLQLERNHVKAALKLLDDNYSDVQRTAYPRLTSEFDALLAQAYWKQQDGANARRYAQNAIDKAVKNEITKPLADAYQVLYEIAKQQGDFETALDYHEKFAAADKGYLNDTSARTLAFQMVNQQVLDKKRQIDALNEKNQRLTLQQEVDEKTTEAARLYIALLILVLASIAFWAYKTKRSQLRFMRLARRDGLTGIFNRQHFIDAASDQLRYCAKSARDACVIVIDLDHFKSVNDVYGHATGDLVLKRAVKSCEDRLRSIDIFGRLGGEEFGIVLPDCALEQALRCAEHLRAAIAAVSGSDARIDFPVSASFGIAATHTSGYDLRELLANADSALYEAKRQGRDRVASYESSNTVRTVEAAAKAAGTR